ncbi:hypothetical protein SRHO_G00211980 [Serrasalmus rhombeus]
MEQKENKKNCSEDIRMSTVTASAHYLRASFGLTDDVFNLVHAEVTAILRSLPLEKKDVLTTKATATFTATLLDDLLVQINSTFTDLFVYANSPHGSPLTATMARSKISRTTTSKIDLVYDLSHQKAKQFFLERIFTLEEATDEAPESVVTAVCEILQDHSVDLLDRFEDNPLFL